MIDYIRSYPLDINYQTRLFNPSVKARSNEHLSVPEIIR